MGDNTVLKNTYHIIFAVDVKYANPNGSPDDDNAPRQDMLTGYGVMTDVCIKRKIRDYVQAAFAGVDGYDIHVVEGVNLNRAVMEAVLTVNETDTLDTLPRSKSGKKADNKKVDESAAYMAARYWDVRTFGGVLSTGANAGQIRGPVQIDMPESVDPIDVENIAVTRVCYTDDQGNPSTLAELDAKDAERDIQTNRTMGNKYVIPYGLYIGHVTVSASFAEKWKFTEKDFDVLLEAMTQMFDFNQTSSKAGMHLALPLIVFKHVGRENPTNADQKEREAKLGCVPAQKLFRLLKIHKKDGVEYPRNLSDYDISFDMDKVPKGVVVGFKENPFEDVSWGDDSVFTDAVQSITCR